MNALLQEEARELARGETEADVRSMYPAMQKLSDTRRKQGKRDPLALVLSSLLLARAAGETTVQAVAQWIGLRGSWLQEVVAGVRARVPCAATSRNVLRAVDPEQLKHVLLALLPRVRARTREPGEQQQVALDGQTLKGTHKHRKEDQRKRHQVSLDETPTGVVLQEHIVAEKESEQSRVGEFLLPLSVEGRIFSADALHTPVSTCASILASGGDSVRLAKGNPSPLREALRLFFREAAADCRDWRSAHTLEKGQGRLESREVVASTELNDVVSTSWPGVGHVLFLRRRVQHPLRCSQQLVYGLSSLSPKLAGPQRLRELIRDHWASENRRHWRRKGCHFAGRCPAWVRKGCPPRTLAVLNRF